MRTSDKKAEQLARAVHDQVTDFRIQMQRPGLQLSYESLDRLLADLQIRLIDGVVTAYRTPVNPRRIKTRTEEPV